MGDSGAPLLQMRGIKKSFGATQALKGIDLTLDRGEVLGLIGENGAGKSTVIKILSGAYHLDEGEILLNGQPVTIGSPKASQQLGISTIYQELTLFPDLDAVENILIGREPTLAMGQSLVSPLDRGRMRREAEELLRDELGVSINLRVPTRQLSLAEKQLVEIARSLYSGAEIIIMDEPTEALESAEREHLFSIIRKLAEQNRAVIYVSHLLDELIRVASQVMVLRDGANVATQPVGELTVGTIINLMIGRELGEKYADKPVPRDQVVLRVENASRAGRFEDVSFDLRRGEILGIAGLDGSGKRELVRALYQSAKLDGGEVQLDGEPLRLSSVEATKRAGLGLMPGDRKAEGLFLEKSLEWNVTIAKLGMSRRTHLPLQTLRARAREYIDLMGIRTRGPGQLVKDLSGGNQQKCLLARWLLTGVDVLVLEEPTRGVDIRSKADIYHRITAAAAEGTSFIIVSADSPELLGLCHRILVMHSGRVAAELDAESADEASIAHYAVQTTKEAS